MVDTTGRRTYSDNDNDLETILKKELNDIPLTGPEEKVLKEYLTKEKEKTSFQGMKKGGKVKKYMGGGKVYASHNKRYAHGGKVSGRKATYKY